MSTGKKTISVNPSDMANPLRIEGPKGVRFAAPEGFRNIKLVLSFDGRAFQGYQYQPHVKTVQETLNRAWAILTGGEQVTLYGCSRLDANVSANQFVLNFFTAKQISCDQIVRGMNGILHSNLHEPISVYLAEDTDRIFNARFDAVGKHYRYRLWYGRGEHAFLTRKSWHVRSANPPEQLGEILRVFEGTKDFCAYRAQDCTAASTVKTVHRIHTSVHPRFAEFIIIDVYGEGFLKNMVRNIVGTAVDTATGKLTIDDIHESFAHRNRTKMGQCAPGHALTLEKVYYSLDEFKNDFEENGSLGSKRVTFDNEIL